MRAPLLAGVVGVVGAMACACSGAPKVTRLTVGGAWARPTPAGATNGVVYFSITSPVDDAITAVSVAPTLAADAAMHETMGGGGASPMPNMPEMTTADGEMAMAPLASVALPAAASVVFRPGGKHVMLTGLVAPLIDGTHFPLTLTTRTGRKLEVDVIVSANPP